MAHNYGRLTEEHGDSMTESALVGPIQCPIVSGFWFLVSGPSPLLFETVVKLVLFQCKSFTNKNILVLML